MLRGAAPVGTHHAEAVGIVDEDAEAVFLLQGHDAGEVAKRPCHTIHALCDDKDAAARLGHHFRGDLQFLLKVFHVVVAVFVLVADVKADAVEQAGVSLVVVNNHVVRIDQSVDG